MPGFSGNLARLFDRLDECCVFHKEGESFVIEEKEKGAEASIQIQSKYECFHVRPDRNKKSFQLLKNKKCADYILFLHNPEDDTWIVHIFEFTKSVGNDTWKDKIVPQFEGALLNAYAICGVINNSKISSVTVHCAYRNNKNLASPVGYKSPLGKPALLPWTSGVTVELLSFQTIYAHKDLIQLDKISGKGPNMELM